MRPENRVIVLFGAAGDLARRKLLPELFHLAAASLMPDRYQIVGSSRRNLTDEQFRALARQAIAKFGISKPTGAAWQAFRQTLSFASAEPADAAPLTAAIEQAERAIGGSPGRLFHLAIPPAAFESAVTMLGTGGHAPGSGIIMEKPFGTDLASAHELNNTVHASFDESHVFRIDHFLGKEPVDNILAFRFANGLFRDEPGRRRDDLPLRRLLLRRQQTRGLRAAHPGCHAWRPVAVHTGRHSGLYLVTDSRDRPWVNEARRVERTRTARPAGDTQSTVRSSTPARRSSLRSCERSCP